MKAFEAENSILVKYNGFTFFKKNQNRHLSLVVFIIVSLNQFTNPGKSSINILVHTIGILQLILVFYVETPGL